MRAQPKPDGTGEGGSTFEVTLRELVHIRDSCREAEDRNGYFPALYAQVTAAVAERSARGDFDDAHRMEELVARFARRYTQAYWAHASQRPTTRSWSLAFETADSNDPLVLQHLLLGINAHINLDLGIVVAELAAARSAPLATVRADFDAINDVLAALVDRCQAAVVAGSPVLAAADVLLGDRDEVATQFSLRAARLGAWEFADRLAAVPSREWSDLIDGRDDGVAGVGLRLLTRAGPVDLAQRVARRLEWSSVPEVIDRLAAVDTS